MLQHHQLPDSTACLLRGFLIITTTGLSPASRRWLSGHTNGGWVVDFLQKHPIFNQPPATQATLANYRGHTESVASETARFPPLLGDRLQSV